jgi:hypothetical protein
MADPELVDLASGLPHIEELLVVEIAIPLYAGIDRTQHRGIGMVITENRLQDLRGLKRDCWDLES